MLSLVVGVMPAASIVSFSVEHHAEDRNPGNRREIFQGNGVQRSPSSVHVKGIPTNPPLHGEQFRVSQSMFRSRQQALANSAGGGCSLAVASWDVNYNILDSVPIWSGQDCLPSLHKFGYPALDFIRKEIVTLNQGIASNTA